MGQVDTTCQADKGLKFVYRLLPGFSLGNGLLQLAFLDLLPLLELTCDRFQGIAAPLHAPYDAFELNAAGWNMLYMGVGAVVYLILAVLIDMAQSNPRLLKTCSRDPAVADEPFTPEDDVVAEEAKCAAQAADLAAKRIKAPNVGLTGAPDAAGAPASGGEAALILLNKMRKVYGDKKVAVKGLSYAIPRGEVFGFLGLNVSMTVMPSRRNTFHLCSRLVIDADEIALSLCFRLFSLHCYFYPCRARASRPR